MSRCILFVFLLAGFTASFADERDERKLRDAIIRMELSAWEKTSRAWRAVRFLSCKPFGMDIVGSAATETEESPYFKDRERYSEFLRTEARAAVEDRMRYAKERGLLYQEEVPSGSQPESSLRISFTLLDETYSVALRYQKRLYDPISKERIFRTMWEIPSAFVQGGEDDMLKDVSIFMDLFLLRYTTVNTIEDCQPNQS